ncbi:MAG: hypothetical protein ACP5PS_00400 [Bacteroidales bacterium]
MWYSDEAYGYPKISYDFQAPIGEFGQIRPSYFRLKVLHHFIHAFGNQLATMTYVPTGNEGKISPDNIQQLRYAVRSNGKSAFLFMLNFQDHAQTKDIQNIQFKINIAGESTVFPQNPFTLKSEENAIFPINLRLGNSILSYATVQPLTHFRQGDTTIYVFFAVNGITPELLINQSYEKLRQYNASLTRHDRGTLVTVNPSMLPALVSLPDDNIKILIISRDMAENTWIARRGNDTLLIFSKALVLDQETNIQLHQRADSSINFSVFPKIGARPRINVGNIENFAGSVLTDNYAVRLPAASASLHTEKIADNKFALQVNVERMPYVSDYFLTINYTADVAMAFIDGRLVTDDFYYGQPWTIGLKKFMKDSSTQIVLYFRPLYPEAKFLNDLPASAIPNFKNKSNVLQLKSVNIAAEYSVKVSF